MSTSGGGTDEGGKPETTSNEAPPEETSSSTTADADAPESPTAEPDVPAEYPESPAPVAQATNYPQLYAPHLTPQPGGGYYMYQQAQITPEPPSPAGPNGMYDAASFRHLSSPFGGQYGGIPQPPLWPRSNMGSMGSIPPASPLFPRVAHSNSGTLDPQQLDSASLHRMNSGGNGGPPSPAPYLSPPLGPSASPYGAMYQGYGGIYNSGSGNNGSEDNAWSDRALYQQASPQLYSVPPRPASNRSYSFDEMLPPSALDPQDQSNPAYSPYGVSQPAPAGVSGTLFAQQTWGYGSSGEIYNAPPSPVPVRPSLPHMPGSFGGGPGGGMRPAVPYGQGGVPYYSQYPATSPGPPIQTTASNKGPDGANLFIFHIPNHFTNLDMYHLFSPYGNLLSVRIMVERDSGRSRGFGFVSYDSPESAAMAIKELNGFAIGNKRLKVQHKQIRAGEKDHTHAPQQQQHYSPGEYEDDVSPHGGSGGGWYEEQKPAPQSSPGDRGDDGERYDGEKADDEGVDLHRSGLGNLEPLRNALPDVTGGTVE